MEGMRTVVLKLKALTKFSSKFVFKSSSVFIGQLMLIVERVLEIRLAYFEALGSAGQASGWFLWTQQAMRRVQYTGHAQGATAGHAAMRRVPQQAMCRVPQQAMHRVPQQTMGRVPQQAKLACSEPAEKAASVGGWAACGSHIVFTRSSPC